MSAATTNDSSSQRGSSPAASASGSSANSSEDSFSPSPSPDSRNKASESSPLLLTVHVANINSPVQGASSSYGSHYYGTTPLNAKTPDGASSAYIPPLAYFRLYPVRWYVLGLFSVMTLFNNMLCYTFASVHRVSRHYYHGSGNYDSIPFGLGMSTLVSCYFVTYIFTCIPVALFIEKFGFKAGVLCGAWLQAIGCFVRVLATPFIEDDLAANGYPLSMQDSSSFRSAHGSLFLLIIGQLIISLGQAFFVNPAPLLAATWFGVNERTIATTIAVNANTLGIAVAYLLGPAIVGSAVDLPRYVLLCFALTLGTALLTTAFFPARPKTPPSHSQTMDFMNAGTPYDNTEDVDELGEQANATPHSATARAQRASSFCFPPSPTKPARSIQDGIPGEASGAPPVGESIFKASPVLDCCSESDDDSSPDMEEDRIDMADGRHSASNHSHSHSHSHAHPHYHAIVPSSTSSSAPAPLSSRHRAHSHSHAKTEAELALEQHFNAMPQPPCDFIINSTLRQERKRMKNSKRLLGNTHVFKRMFASPGFLHTLLVFGISEALINGISAFMNEIVSPLGYTSMIYIGYMVCAFIGMCMCGSAVFGFIVDRKKSYKMWILIALVGSSLSLLYLIHIVSQGGLTQHLWFCILCLGFFVGPIQPLSIETAVEVTYPSPESSVTAVQQVLGNLFSAGLFPLIIYLRDPQTKSMVPALWLFTVTFIGSTLIYLTFNGTYKRLLHEREKDKQHRDLHRKIYEEEKKLKEEKRQELLRKLNSYSNASPNPLNNNVDVKVEQQQQTTPQRIQTGNGNGSKTRTAQ